MMSEKRFIYKNNKVYDNLNGEFHSSNMVSVNLLNELNDENEQLRQVVEQYRKTNKHLSELCADASKNGYLPPLEDLR